MEEILNGSQAIRFAGGLMDSVTGSAKNDYIQMGANNDNAQGGLGNDVIFGQEGNDYILAGPYAATAEDARKDQDFVVGGDGRDIVLGGANADVLLGGDGSDAWKNNELR
jgi:Ca2+-binding RTX toxin-like protein